MELYEPLWALSGSQSLVNNRFVSHWWTLKSASIRQLRDPSLTSARPIPFLSWSLYDGARNGLGSNSNSQSSGRTSRIPSMESVAFHRSPERSKLAWLTLGDFKPL